MEKREINYFERKAKPYRRGGNFHISSANQFLDLLAAQVRVPMRTSVSTFYRMLCRCTRAIIARGPSSPSTLNCFAICGLLRAQCSNSSVNLNWSLSTGSMRRCCNAAETETVRPGRVGLRCGRLVGSPVAGREEHVNGSGRRSARGLSSEDAAVFMLACRPPVGGRWFREGGGMKVRSALAPRSARSLSFARAGRDRDPCALRAPGCVT